MEFKLSAQETLGVVTIGAVLGLIVDRMTHDESTPIEHRRKIMAAGAGLYVLGVVVGTMRPEEGYMKMIGGE